MCLAICVYTVDKEIVKFYYSPKASGIPGLSSGKPGKKYPENPAESPPSVWRVNPVKKTKIK